jgi:hypothetical protein
LPLSSILNIKTNFKIICKIKFWFLKIKFWQAVQVAGTHLYGVISVAKGGLRTPNLGTKSKEGVGGGRAYKK